MTYGNYFRKFGGIVYKKVSLEDFLPLRDEEIVNRNHYEAYVTDNDEFVMYSVCNNFEGLTAHDFRKENKSLKRYDIYEKKSI
jgi:hypothetical protein